ncbi:MAG: HEAT repeat domain-containing protein [bacterium]|nr:HEAT repeat domain-containing protein [bacterium]
MKKSKLLSKIKIYLCFLLVTICFLTASAYQLSPMDSLFVRASTGEIKYLQWNKPARDSFVNLGETAIPYLLKKLDTDDAREQHTLIDILKKMKVYAVAPLISKASEGDRGSKLAVYVLGEIGDTLAVSPLLSLLDKGDWQLKANCLVALGKIGDIRATYKIIPYVQDTILSIRRSASIALSKLGDSTSTKSLVNAIFDSCYSVRFAASSGLIKIGQSAVNPLIKSLTTALPPINYLIIYTLGEIKDKKAITELRKLLKSSDSKVRGFTVEALGKLGDYKTIKKLHQDEQNGFVKDKLKEALEH